jgi:hypothetical protein
MPISPSIRALTQDDTLDPSVDRLKGHRLLVIRCPASLRLVRLTTRANAPGHGGEVCASTSRCGERSCELVESDGFELDGGMTVQGYGPPPSCLAFGQERFDRLVKGAAPLLDLLIADECHGVPDQILLLLRDTSARAEVQKGIGCCLRRI